jgi:hypothetical protein
VGTRTRDGSSSERDLGEAERVGAELRKGKDRTVERGVASSSLGVATIGGEIWARLRGAGLPGRGVEVAHLYEEDSVSLLMVGYLRREGGIPKGGEVSVRRSQTPLSAK